MLQYGWEYVIMLFWLINLAVNHDELGSLVCFKLEAKLICNKSKVQQSVFSKTCGATGRLDSMVITYLAPKDVF